MNDINRRHFVTGLATAALSIPLGLHAQPSSQLRVDRNAIAETWRAVGDRVFADCVGTAEVLNNVLKEWATAPTRVNWSRAKASWRQARKPYMQSVVFGLGAGDLRKKINDGVTPNKPNQGTGFHALEYIIFGISKPNGTLIKLSEQLVDDLKKLEATWNQVKTRVNGSNVVPTILQSAQIVTEFMAQRTLSENAIPEDPYANYSHWSLYYQSLGVRNVFRGEYLSVNRRVVKDTSIEQMLDYESPGLGKQVKDAVERTHRAMTRLSAAAEDYRNPVSLQTMQARQDALVVEARSALRAQSALFKRLLAE